MSTNGHEMAGCVSQPGFNPVEVLVRRARAAGVRQRLRAAVGITVGFSADDQVASVERLIALAHSGALTSFVRQHEAADSPDPVGVDGFETQGG